MHFNNTLSTELWRRWNFEIKENRVRKKEKVTLPLDSTFDMGESGRQSIIKYMSKLEKTLPVHLWNTAVNKGVKAAHKEFCKVIGIGPKIASFYMRDISQVLESNSELDRIEDRENYCNLRIYGLTGFQTRSFLKLKSMEKKVINLPLG